MFDELLDAVSHQGLGELVLGVGVELASRVESEGECSGVLFQVVIDLGDDECRQLLLTVSRRLTDAFDFRETVCNLGPLGVDVLEDLLEADLDQPWLRVGEEGEVGGHGGQTHSVLILYY